MKNPCQLFVTADDRTGALEVGGIVANAEFSVPVGPGADSEVCCVVDIASRHLSPELAADIVSTIHQRPARHRCHKMDSGLRGNWPYEVRALNKLGLGVAVVPSFPDAGRRCKDGIVYIQDVPVLDSPFGQDPLTAPISSRPDEVLEAAGCQNGDVVIWDADNNHELAAMIQRCRQENRVLVGPTGAIGAYANTVFPNMKSRKVGIQTPLLVVCGSLNPTSREQISRLDFPVFGLEDSIDLSQGIAILKTVEANEVITTELALNVARQMAEKVSLIEPDTATLFIIGGDTSAAIVGDETLEVLGCLDAGVPISNYRGRLLITKGGGIGTVDTISRLLAEVAISHGRSD